MITYLKLLIAIGFFMSLCSLSMGQYIEFKFEIDGEELPVDPNLQVFFVQISHDSSLSVLKFTANNGTVRIPGSFSAEWTMICVNFKKIFVHKFSFKSVGDRKIVIVMGIDKKPWEHPFANSTKCRFKKLNYIKFSEMVRSTGLTNRRKYMREVKKLIQLQTSRLL